MQLSSSTGSRKCAHGPCNCMVSSTERYCSDYCEMQVSAPRQDTAGSAGCGCGHAECNEPPRDPRG